MRMTSSIRRKEVTNGLNNYIIQLEYDENTRENVLWALQLESMTP
jgi:hypothetical protein